MLDKTDTSDNWHIGEVLPGGYRVTAHLGQGGMGTVFLVERRISTKIQQFAVKTLIPKMSSNADRTRNFLRELRTWIDLPTHANLARCCFFRTIKGTLAIFAEYVKGASLDKWILKNRQAAIGTLLDLAIQMARGIHCAHQSGVIHQDIKPSNVLVSTEGIAKITDFGLSRFRFTGEELKHPRSSESTFLVSSQGMTLPYCSPEQANSDKLSRKTDMWSYALTVLQMFNGGLNWRFGSTARHALDEYLTNGPSHPMPPMPDGVANILRQCFQDDPGARWKDMSVIESMLIQEYEAVTNIPYPRKSPAENIAEIPQQELKERTTAGGGKWVDPEALLKFALEQTKTESAFCWEDLPDHNQSTERGSALRDIEVFEIVEQFYRDYHATRDTSLETITSYANVMFNKALAVEACKDMIHAAEIYSRIQTVLKGVDNPGACELSARSALNRSICHCIIGEIERAIQDIDFAVDQYKRLVRRYEKSRYSKNMVISLMNQSVIKDNYGAPEAGMISMQEAVDACETLLLLENSNANWNQMGFIQMNLGMAMVRRNQNDDAMDAFNQAFHIYEMLLDHQISNDIIVNYALLHLYRAQVLRKNGNLDKAEDLLISGHDFVSDQLKSHKREELRSVQVKILEQFSEIRLLMKDYTDSLKYMAEAEKMIEQLAVQEDEVRHMVNYRRIILKRSAIMFAVGNKSDAMNKGADALVMWIKEALDKKWNPESTCKNITENIEELISDLELYNLSELAAETRKLIQILCKKIRSRSKSSESVI